MSLPPKFLDQLFQLVLGNLLSPKRPEEYRKLLNDIFLSYQFLWYSPGFSGGKIEEGIPVVRAFFYLERPGIFLELFPAVRRRQKPALEFTDIAWIQLVIDAELPQSLPESNPTSFEKFSKILIFVRHISTSLIVFIIQRCNENTTLILTQQGFWV